MSHTRFTLAGVPKSAEAYAISELLKDCKDGCLVHVAVNDRALVSLADALAFFAPETEVLQFPAWDSMPYDRNSPQAGIMAARMLVLSRLTQPSAAPLVILTTANAITQKLPPRAVMQKVALSLAVGQSISQSAIVDALIAQGYRRSSKAMEPGEFALRGSIIDIVAPGMSDGVRIDFFGNDIETIRAFDPLSQITHGKLDNLSLYPVSEVLLNENSRELFRQRYRELFGAVTKEDPLYEAISEGRHWPGMEHWLPLFYEHTDTLLDYCPSPTVTFDAEVKSTIEERAETIADYYQARLDALKHSSKKHSFSQGAIYHPLPPEQLYLTGADWQNHLSIQPKIVDFSPFLGSENISLGCKPAMRFTQSQPDNTPFDQLRQRATLPTLLACFTKGSLERLQTLLMEHNFHTVRIEHWSELKSIKGKTIGLAVLPLDAGFETASTLILSEQDLLGERILRASSKKKKSDVFMLEAANFAEGELVTHKEHGIGRFEGLITLTVNNASHDCLKLIYADDDKLFLPVENIEMIARFGLEEDGVKLDKLGGASWQSRKARLKQKLLMAAAELLNIAAQRQVKQGAVLEAPVGTYDDFCARFPYVETEDQARAITDVIEDLHSGKPMDRLVCGDVGFGKTEVALRAAFVATAAGGPKLQVAVIVPTTLLARQHYNNFKARFEGFPVVIRQLSRMVSAKDQKETHALLAEGKVDIVIGTHALLAKQAKFHNLGLLIVDEEQHFGVAQKEKLKGLKSDIHVLTLSATPIPRTLQMALTGVRDLSLITTPPIDRLAVRSFVMPFDPVVLREAIQRELHRGGRCFVVCPRIKDIAEAKAQISELVPDAKLVVAHGQMPASDLDGIMNDFYDGKFDVLLSTAIIESGLDIPSANTMIIFNAHLFGLSQLYQLRGRVGRGKTRAYAYFVLPHHRTLTKNATRRLEVMQTLDTLGAGFTLASHDMDIRGFGNLVGEEQSGHIREVGIELYQQMLEEAVAQLKQDDGWRMTDDKNRKESDLSSVIRHPSSDWSPQINLGISVLIPETYVDDLQLRLGLYRRAAGLATDDDINSFASELIDRFGDMPEETSHLIATLGLKMLCKKAGIERIDVGPKGAVLSFRNNSFAQLEKLLAYVSKNIRHLKLRPDQKLVFTQEFTNAEDKLGKIKKLTMEIAGINTIIT